MEEIKLTTKTVRNPSSSDSALLDFELKHGDSLEIQTMEQLLKLNSTYGLEPWIFTNKIAIDSDFRTVPHSHPVLTLNTRHTKDDELLMATLIHEQLHWFVSGHPSKEKVLNKLQVMYPKPVTEFPYGSGGEIDTHYHIMICYLEYKGLKQLIGELKAFQVISFWQQDHYHWIYETILEDQLRLEKLASEMDLVPGPTK